MSDTHINLGKQIQESLAEKHRRVFGARTINDYFEALSPAAAEAWPFNLNGYQTAYTATEKVPYNEDCSNPLYGMKFSAELSSRQEKLKLAAVFYMIDDQVVVHWDNLYRAEGEGSSLAAPRLLRNFRNFIEAQDRGRSDRGYCPSEIQLEATSNNDRSGVASCGGYIWAGQGFDFADVGERRSMWTHFVSFASRHGVNIDAKDYKNFAKPVHFFSFNCGVKIKDKTGHSSYLGKAFLLLHESWKGRIISGTSNSEESRYAAVYNSPEHRGFRHAAAFNELNSGYRKMVRRYFLRHAERKPPHLLKKISRLASIKLIRMRNSLTGRF